MSRAKWISGSSMIHHPPARPPPRLGDKQPCPEIRAGNGMGSAQGRLVMQSTAGDRASHALEKGRDCLVVCVDAGAQRPY